MAEHRQRRKEPLTGKRLLQLRFLCSIDAGALIERVADGTAVRGIEFGKEGAGGFGGSPCETGDRAGEEFGTAGGGLLLQPSGGRFRATVLGEWSDTTMSMSPAASPSHSRSRLRAPRIGGQHLNSVAPSGTSSASKNT